MGEQRIAAIFAANVLVKVITFEIETCDHGIKGCRHLEESVRVNCG
jgi:hypothetical protein